MKKLHLTNTEYNPSGLHIIDNSEQPILANGDIIVSERVKSYLRPMHCSELSKKMQLRSYNKAEGIFVTIPDENSNEEYPDILKDVEWRNYLDYPAADEIDVRPITEEEKKAGKYIQLDKKINKDNLNTRILIEKIENFYKKIFGTMTIKEVSFYNTSRNIIDILDNTTVIDLIKPFSDIYTDTISIDYIFKLPFKEKVSGLVGLTIQYTKQESDDSIKVYSHDSTFQAFKYDDKGELVIDNLIEDIESDVRLEYINGVIKVYPLRNNITECIIYKCDITYGTI